MPILRSVRSWITANTSISKTKISGSQKKQTVIQVKEVKIRPKTDEHDLLVKIKHVRRFLAQKDKAKITILFRGREISYSDQGTKCWNGFERS